MKNNLRVTFGILMLLAVSLLAGHAEQRVETPESWFAEGQRAVQAAKQTQRNTNRARSVILFLGDGMGISTITAARILEGQMRGQSGEENSLSFEKLPCAALSKTYSVNQQVPDSAPTMTAIVTGVKTKDAMLSVNQNAVRGDYRTAAGNELTTILEIMKASGRSVGVVTTTRITHATPAACYAHTPERDWESDADLSDDAREAGFPDIARQLVEFPIEGGIDVMLGGGRGKFLPRNVSDPKEKRKHGTRLDGRNLIEEWTTKTGGSYVWNKGQLDSISAGSTTRLLGLFNYSHMSFEHDRPKDAAGEPSLSEMTAKAIDILSKNTNGFFLMVEGGRIDHAHHYGNAYRALTETIEFSRAVASALDRVKLEDTLVIVTADHSHTLTIAGYPQRGNNILGTVVGNPQPETSDGMELDEDGLGEPYTTLNYANGPGYTGASSAQGEGSKTYPHTPKHFLGYSAGRPKLKSSDTEQPNYLQEAVSPKKAETHSGEDVAIFAGGPWAWLFHGVIEENVIFHVMLEAIQVPPSSIQHRQVFSKQAADSAKGN